MKQLIQSLKSGFGEVIEVPIPESRPGHLLIATANTLISAGTERTLVRFGKSNIIGKALQQPDKVRQVLAKISSDGLRPTIDAVASKLDMPLALGYCNMGVVMQADVTGFAVGDRVVSNGNHAEVVRVPQNLCAKVPGVVDDECASFTVLGAIGLQGIRLAQPTIGEAFVVQGLGLIGLMTVQMLRANGCRVLGVDFDSGRCELAKRFGASTVNLSKGEDPIVAAKEFSRGYGVDAVLICASTQSDEVVHQAAEMCRKRGRIVLVGVIGLNLRRDDFYKKELSFQVSASYGPGRYDPVYEDQGVDYPIGFVRWTQQRNFEAVLDMMAAGTLNVRPLITHRFGIADAIKAYELLDDDKALGILIDYPDRANFVGDAAKTWSGGRTVSLLVPRDHQVVSERRCSDTARNTSQGSDISTTIGGGVERRQPAPIVAFIGAGNYASRILIPAFRRANVELHTLVSSTGVSCVHHGRKAGFIEATTDLNTILKSPRIDTVVIATRHNAHASQVVASLEVGKHVFVEKPLCLTLVELDEIRKTLSAKISLDGMKAKPILMVGFNRRFSPHIQRIKTLLDSVAVPKSFIMTVNAGAIPAEHWTQDSESGGGRIIGEACHFIDLLRFLAGVQISDFDSSFMAGPMRDTASISLKFADGSVGTIHYFANGSRSFPKERLEVFTAGRVLSLDNFRKLSGYGWPGFSKMNLWSQDKGQRACVEAFVNSIRQGSGSPISLAELLEVAEVTIKLAK